MNDFRHLYGPVPSRRLGLSLGVDIIPPKTCSISCIYCQVGITEKTTVERKDYIKSDEILNEISRKLKTPPKPDWITFSGSGEPTLNSEIGKIIKGIGEITDIPVCVITNGTLLWMPEVRENISGADAVMPSLDSAIESTFSRICNPHESLAVGKIVDGLVEFRKEYAGKIWLEILFVKGFNDSPEEIDALLKAVEKINPDSIQLNTVARPPAESCAKPVSVFKLEEFRKIFGEKAVIIASFPPNPSSCSIIIPDDVEAYLKRRPGTLEDISSSLSASISEVETILSDLENSGVIFSNVFLGKKFWEHSDNSRKS